MLPRRNRMTTFLLAPLLLTMSGPLSGQDEIVDLNFEQPPASGSDEARTLQSLKKIQGTGQFCQDGLYLMTHFGNREVLFEEENQRAIDEPMVNQTWRYCSLFSASNGTSVVMGRNWDNQTVGSIIVSLYRPTNGYASVSFTRSIDLGFGHKNLDEFMSSPFAKQLLLAPFYSQDGINEHGVAVGVAGVKQVSVKPGTGKKPVFISFLIRKILDQTKTIEEAVRLVDQFIPFDLDERSLNGHLLIADSSGKSVILEYVEDQWRAIRSDKAWQVLANKPIYNMPDTTLRRQCLRYRSMSETLEQSMGRVDWNAGLKILRDVEQKGTTWSVVYSLPTREVHFCVYQDRSRVYHLKGF